MNEPENEEQKPQQFRWWIGAEGDTLNGYNPSFAAKSAHAAAEEVIKRRGLKPAGIVSNKWKTLDNRFVRLFIEFVPCQTASGRNMLRAMRAEQEAKLAERQKAEEEMDRKIQAAMDDLTPEEILRRLTS